MKPEWPLGRPEAAAPETPLLPLALPEHVELIKGGLAVDAFARKRATQIITHGHTPEADLLRTIDALAYEAKARLNAFTEIVGRNRLMNLPPERHDQCLRYVEISGALHIALYERLITPARDA